MKKYHILRNGEHYWGWTTDHALALSMRAQFTKSYPQQTWAVEGLPVVHTTREELAQRLKELANASDPR